MVHLILFPDAAQDGNAVLHARFLHHHGLEAALEGGVFFDIFAVFIDGSGSDAVQGTPRQGGFQHVGGVHRPLRRAGPHHGVDFIYKKDDAAFRLFHLGQHRFEAFLKLAAELRPRHQGGHVQFQDFLVFQVFRNVPRDHAARQAFHDGGFAHAGFADQDGIVLAAAGKDLHAAADFLVSADHRVKLFLTRQADQITGVLFQRLVFRLRVLVRNALIAAQFLEREQQPVRVRSGFAQQTGCFLPLAQGGQKYVLQADVFVLQLLRLALALVQDVQHLFREIDLRAAHPGQFFKLILHFGGQRGGNHLQLLQRGQDQGILLLQHRRQQVQVSDLLMSV